MKKTKKAKKPPVKKNLKPSTFPERAHSAFLNLSEQLAWQVMHVKLQLGRDEAHIQRDDGDGPPPKLDRISRGLLLDELELLSNMAAVVNNTLYEEE